MKLCPKCGVEKKLTEFGKQTRRKDGLRHVCKICNNIEACRWGKENPEKAAAGAKRWAAANPERRKEITDTWLRENEHRNKTVKQKYYDAHRAELVASATQWRKENRERRNTYVRKYSKQPAHRAYAYAYWNARRAAKMDATPSWLTNIQHAQMQEFYDIAIALTTQTGSVYHVDHVHPLKGENFRGLHVPWNLQVLTAFDNVSKGNRLVGG